jgi:hypothetical protein
MRTWKVSVVDGDFDSYNDPWPQVPAFKAVDAVAAAEAAAKWALAEVVGSPDYRDGDAITVRVFDGRYVAHRMVVECP